jgi:hypothetical protein
VIWRCSTPLTIKTYPNQKPWINGSIRVKLKARTIAFNHGMVTGNMTEYEQWASRVAQWSKALHCSASCVTRDPDSSPDSVAAGYDQETQGRSTIGPALSGLAEDLAGSDALVPSRTSDSCGGLGAMHADTVARCTVLPPDTLVQLASWLSGHCVKKQCGLAGLCFGGRMALDPSPYRSCSDGTRR